MTRVARVLHREDGEHGALTVRDGSHLGAHGGASHVAGRHEVRIVADVRRVLSGEEPHHVPRPARAVGLAASHGGEQRVAGVLLRPDHREARRAVLAVPSVVRGQVQLIVSRRVVVHARVADVAVLAHVAGVAVVGVGGGDDPEAERVDAEHLLLEQPLLQGVADERQPGERLVGIARPDEHLPTEQLESALLVGRVDAGPALRAALVLVDLDERLHRGTRGGVGSGERAVVGVLGHEHEPVPADVRIVRDREPVTAGKRVLTERLERRPEALRRVLIDVGHRHRRDRRVPEDDVSMEVGEAGRSRPFIRDERGERARRRAVVVLLRGGLMVEPEDRLARNAFDAIRSADRGVVGGVRADDDRQKEVQEHLQHEARIVADGRLPQRLAGGGVVAVQVRPHRGVEADLLRPESLRVIRDGGEVEGPPELHRVCRVPLGIEGSQAEGRTLRELVRLPGSGERVEEYRVDRLRRVDVRVAEVRIAQNVERGAVRASLRPLPGRWRRGRRGGAGCQDQGNRGAAQLIEAP